MQNEMSRVQISGGNGRRKIGRRKIWSSDDAPMTLVGAILRRRKAEKLRDDIVSYEQFAERFFERIKDDKRWKEGEKLGTNDVNDDKETRRRKRKRRNIAKAEWIAVATIAFYRKNRCANHPRRKNSTTKMWPFMKKWRDEFDFDWLEYADDLEHP